MMRARFVDNDMIIYRPQLPSGGCVTFFTIVVKIIGLNQKTFAIESVTGCDTIYNLKVLLQARQIGTDGHLRY